MSNTFDDQSVTDIQRTMDDVRRLVRRRRPRRRAVHVNYDNGGGSGGGGTVQPTDSNTYNIRATDQGTVAGTARGENSVDLQTIRSNSSEVASGINSTISGGRGNEASATNATAGGGINNKVTGGSAVVAGGSTNTAGPGIGAAVCGGVLNVASGTRAFVGSGNLNEASGNEAAVLSGVRGDASGSRATVVNGIDSTASGDFSSVIGGDNSEASGDYSTTFGEDALATDAYQIAHAHSSGTSPESPGRLQTSQRIDHTATSGTSPQKIEFSVPNDSTWAYELLLSARSDESTNVSAGWTASGVIENNGGTTALVGTGIGPTSIGDGSAGAWSVAIAADNTNDTLEITVTGESGKDVDWVAYLRTVEIKS